MDYTPKSIEYFISGNAQIMWVGKLCLSVPIDIFIQV